ncbi:MAG: hypothetical protein AOA65_0615 [Candidatus Bathyarchaeota archaeon BA1]|nr:MAG: hypothetical protein AOA65_0615 [Candidatus Bathyarchaeota archaeon BA1]
MKKYVLILCLFLTLSATISTALAMGAPPTITAATLEKTKLYRGLQTLRASLTATDDKTPVAKLKVDTTIVFADGQTITAPMVYEPVLKIFYRFLLIPEAVGTGIATITMTVIDTDGEKNSTTLKFEVYDHKPVLAAKEEAVRAITTAIALISSWAELGINMTTPTTLIAEAESTLDLAEVVLKSLEDVEGAMTYYKEAKASAELAVEKAKASVGLHKAAEKAKEEARLAIERAKTYIDAWLPKVLNMTTSLGQLKLAETEYASGLKLIVLEGSPGATSAFIRAKTHAEYALASATTNVKAFSIASEKMAKAKATIDSLTAYVNTLKALGVDMGRTHTLLDYVNEIYKMCEAAMVMEGVPGVSDALDTVIKKASEALTEAETAAKGSASDSIGKAKGMLAFIKGRLFTPDTKLAEALIDLAEKSFGEKDYPTAIARADQALIELMRLEGPQTAAINTATSSVVIILIAIVISFLLLRRRPVAKA